MQLVTTNLQTMTSREIAELVETRHDSVMKCIERLIDAKAIDGYPPLSYTHPQNKQTYQEYRVGKRDSYVIVAQLSPQFTARLVDRWQELEAAAPAFDWTNAVALRDALLVYSERVITLEAKVAIDAPKVAFAEIIRDVDGVCHIGNIGKMFGIGRTKFFKRLRDDGILMANNLPYQKYIDREYFTVIEQEPYIDSKGVSHPTFTAMVTGAGQVFLAKRYKSLVMA